MLEANLKNARILMVDDQPANIALLQGLLAREGYSNLKSLNDSRQAPAAFDEFQPDIILLDLHMPHLDGFALLDLLKARTPAGEYLPVLVLTADVASETKLNALLRGAHDFLAKPLDLAETSLRVRNLLHARYLNQQLRVRSAMLEERAAELSLLNIELNRANRAKDEFLANMSHELRTPLNSIIGLSESLSERIAGDLTEKQDYYLGMIRESGQHLLDLINDILDLAKIESGQSPLEKEEVDVSQVCQSSLRMVKQLVSKKNQEVSLELDPGLVTIHADGRRLKQMLVNLLTNAVKFTPENGKIGLHAGGDREKGAAQFSVSDTGIGIAEEDLPRLFLPFVQLESDLARQSTGTGLGLALVAKMAALHGGSVSVESQPGQGSRFTVTLPWRAGIASPLSAIKTGRLRLKADSANHGRAILLVEDSEDAVLLFKDYLEDAGFEVTVARNGSEGVALAEKIAPSLILMDVQMPGVDGLEATRRIRMIEALKDTPIVALTALAMKGDRERCMAAGMNDYLTKPVNLKILLGTIGKHLGVENEPPPS